MKPTSTEHVDVMEHLALVSARQQRDQYLQQLGALLASLGGGAPTSLEAMRECFRTYECPESPSLSAAIEAMREAR
jgi:hypothetical protein